MKVTPFRMNLRSLSVVIQPDQYKCWLMFGIVLAAGCTRPSPVRLTSDETEKAAIEIRETSASLQQRYRVTPHASNGELGGRVIEVTGPVVLVGMSAELGHVMLLSGGTKGSLPVICQMARQRPWDQVTPGMLATVKGQLWPIKPGSTPLILQAHLTQVDAEAAETVRFTAEQICSGYSENRSEAQNLLADRWVRIWGEVSSVDRINNWLYLKGGTNCLVRCSLAGKDGELFWEQDLNAGEWIEVVGQVQNGDRKQVILQGCLPPRRKIEPEGPVTAGNNPVHTAGSSD